MLAYGFVARHSWRQPSLLGSRVLVATAGRLCLRQASSTLIAKKPHLLDGLHGTAGSRVPRSHQTLLCERQPRWVSVFGHCSPDRLAACSARRLREGRVGCTKSSAVKWTVNVNETRHIPASSMPTTKVPTTTMARPPSQPRGIGAIRQWLRALLARRLYKFYSKCMI